MTAVKFESTPVQEGGEKLLDLSQFDFILEPQYFNQGLSPTAKMYLRESVVKKLLAVQQKLQKYKLKIWDGFRSREVQRNIYQKFWDDLKKKNPDWDDKRLANEVAVFVTQATNPNRIPPHTSGGAVDLTLADENGQELNMGTIFDYFGPEAAPLYFEENDINETVKQNRRILREALRAEGFRFDKDEWWHFDYGNQLWAFGLGKPQAIYGEAPTPKR